MAIKKSSSKKSPIRKCSFKLFSNNKLFVNKKAKVFALGLLIAVILSNVFIGYIIITKYFGQGPQTQKAIGETQGSLLYAYQKADNELFIINQLALLSLKKTNKEFAFNGLTISTPVDSMSDTIVNPPSAPVSSPTAPVNSPSAPVSSPSAPVSSSTAPVNSPKGYSKVVPTVNSNTDCGSILGVKKWFSSSKENNNLITSFDCVPKTDKIKDLFKQEFKHQLSKSFLEQGLNLFNYELLLSQINVDGSNILKIIGKTDDQIRVPILDRVVDEEKYSKIKNYFNGCTSDVDSTLANKGFCKSPNENDKSTRTIDTVVIHYTATSTAQEALSIFKDPNSKVSAHYLIDKNGDIYQLVREKDIAWHAGCSDDKNKQAGKLAYCAKGTENINSRSIGVELVNEGWNCKNDCVTAKQICYPDLKKEVCDSFVNRKWAKFNKEQYDALVNLLVDILKRNNLQVDSIIGHEQVNPIRKQDPGPLLDLNELKNKVDYVLNKKITINYLTKDSPKINKIVKDISEEPLSEEDIKDKDCGLETTPNYDSKLSSDVSSTKKNLESSLPDAIDFIRKISKEEGISPAIILALITQESKGINHKKNSAGAYGVMQLTSVAIKAMNDKYGDELVCNPSYEANDVKCQIRYGLKYLVTRDSSSKEYGGQAYCASNMNCFSSSGACHSKYGSCSLITVQKRVYKGTDAQIRYYNGWSIYGWPDHDYVENVKRYVPYWNSLLCLDENVNPTEVEGAKVIGEHLLKADFVVTGDDSLNFYESVIDVAKKIISDCKDSNGQKTCFNKYLSSLSSKIVSTTKTSATTKTVGSAKTSATTKPIDFKLLSDEDCYPFFYDQHPFLFREASITAPKTIEQSFNQFINIRDCVDNNQEYCTCSIDLQKDFKLVLKKDSQVVVLDYDVPLTTTKDEFFYMNLPELVADNDYSFEKESSIVFFKDSKNKIKVFNPQTDQAVRPDGTKIPVKECSPIKKNHLFCASKKIDNKEVNVLFYLELGKLQTNN